jgi:hypothetical protein
LQRQQLPQVERFAERRPGEQRRQAHPGGDSFIIGGLFPSGDLCIDFAT